MMAGGASSPSDLSTFTRGVVRVTINDWSDLKVQRLKGSTEVGFGISTAAAAADRMWVFGGAEFDAQTQVRNRDAVFAFDEANASQPSIKPKLPHAVRGLAAIALSPQHIYVAGGYPNDETGFTDEAWIFIATTGQFVPAKALPIKVMIHLATDGKWVYCLGGEDKKKHRSDKVWRIAARELLAPVMVK